MRFVIPDAISRARHIHRTLACLLVVGAAAVSVATPYADGQDLPLPPPPSDTLARDIGTVRPGDLLTLAVFQHSELSGTFLIDPRGYVNIPGIGSIRVAGLTPTQLYERFRQEMSPRILNPDFAVGVQIRVFVLGEVGNGGLHPVEPGTTLLQILTIAGGPGPRADLKHTRVLRDGRSFEVDLKSGLEGGGAGRIVLFSNDYVIVSQRTGRFTRENIAFVVGGVSAVLTFANLIISLQRSR